jgi:hypothetical protein
MISRSCAAVSPAVALGFDEGEEVHAPAVNNGEFETPAIFASALSTAQHTRSSGLLIAPMLLGREGWEVIRCDPGSDTHEAHTKAF